MEDGPAYNTRNFKTVKNPKGEKQHGDIHLKVNEHVNIKVTPSIAIQTPFKNQEVLQPLEKYSPVLNKQDIARIKIRARRLSVHTSTIKETQSPSKPLKRGATKKTRHKSMPAADVHVNDTHSELQPRKQEMDAISEIIGGAHAVLQTNGNSNLTDSTKDQHTEDNEVSFKDPKTTTSQTTEHGDDNMQNGSSKTTHNSAPEPEPDYENMSNADMIRLFMNTMVQHKNELKNEISKQSQKITSIETKQTSIQTELEDLKTSQEENHKNTSDLQTTVENLQSQVCSLVNFVVRQDSLIKEEHDKFEKEDSRNLRGNVIISGIVETKPENCMDKVKEFFDNILKVEQQVAVKNAFRIGKGKTRPILVYLRSPSEKGKIYKRTKFLKDIKNNEGKPYRVRDHMTAKNSALDDRHRDLLWENKKLINTQDHLDMTLKQGVLTINNSTYKKLVEAPSTKQVLKASVADQIRWRKIKCVPGNIVHKDACQFIGYSVIAAKIETIRNAYLQLREKHSDARHIICAYRLPGRNFAILQDFVDDDEHKAGKTLLDLLKKADIFNRAVFVVRYYGGAHLGPARFEAILEAARTAILKDPYNYVSKCNQTPWPTTQPSYTGQQQHQPPPPLSQQHQFQPPATHPPSSLVPNFQPVQTGTMELVRSSMPQTPATMGHYNMVRPTIPNNMDYRMQHPRPNSDIQAQTPMQQQGYKDRQLSGPTKPMQYIRGVDPTDDWDQYYQRNYASTTNWDDTVSTEMQKGLEYTTLQMNSLSSRLTSEEV